MSEQDDVSLVLYSDGSAKPNPGNIGYGVHGYSFKLEEPKNKVAVDENFYSVSGYQPKSADYKNSTVTPIKIINAYGSDTENGTNNSAELKAYLASLNIAKEQGAKNLLVNTDSKYVCKGASEWLGKWATAGWLNSEGRPISNSQLWKEVKYSTDALKRSGTTININWVKGHAGEYGNEKADFLATMGRMKSIKGVKTEVVNTADITEDIKRDYSAERHPLISKPWMYFSTITNHIVNGQYYLGNIGKDKDFLGRKDANGGYAIVQLKEPFEPLELARRLQCKLSPELSDVFVLNLNMLFSGKRANTLMEYGEDCLVKFNPRREDLYFIEHMPSSFYNAVSIDEEGDEQEEDEKTIEPLSRQQKPQKLSLRVYECLTAMKIKLDEYSSGDKRYNSYYDITGEFFDIVVTSSKNGQETKYKFKKELDISTKFIDTQFAWEGYTVPIRIDLDIDAPSRNAIKKLEKLSPKIVLQVFKESDEILRYNVIIETIDSLSIWSGFYSNYLILTNQMKTSS